MGQEGQEWVQRPAGEVRARGQSVAGKGQGKVQGQELLGREEGKGLGQERQWVEGKDWGQKAGLLKSLWVAGRAVAARVKEGVREQEREQQGEERESLGQVALPQWLPAAGQLPVRVSSGRRWRGRSLPAASSCRCTCPRPAVSRKAGVSAVSRFTSQTR